MNTIVYGISPSTEMFIRSSFNKKNNIFVSTHGGEKFRDITAKPLTELKKIDKKTIDRVVICSEFVSEILLSLNECGICIDICFFFNHLIEDLKPCKELELEEKCFDDTLFAFYDLGTFIPSYDVITFVILSEIERIKLNKKHIQFVLVPSGTENNRGINVYYSQSDTQWRINKIILPIFSLVKSYNGVDCILTRDQLKYYQLKKVSTYPQGYFLNNNASSTSFKLLKSYVNQGVKLSHLSPPEQACQIVDSYLEKVNIKNKKVITITLREYWANAEGRNSNLKAWLEFAKEIQNSEYFPIIIRDTYSLGTSLPNGYNDLDTFDLASVDLHIRAAIYLKAHINMGVESGPVYLISYLKKAKSIIFKKIDNDIPCISERSITTHLFQVGESHYFNDNPHQVTAWMDDSFENIQTQFSLLENKINKAAI